MPLQVHPWSEILGTPLVDAECNYVLDVLRMPSIFDGQSKFAVSSTDSCLSASLRVERRICLVNPGTTNTMMAEVGRQQYVPNYAVPVRYHATHSRPPAFESSGYYHDADAMRVTARGQGKLVLSSWRPYALFLTRLDKVSCHIGDWDAILSWTILPQTSYHRKMANPLKSSAAP